MAEKYVIGFGDNKVDYYSNYNIKFPGGNAANFSVVSKRQGVKSYFIGTISKDDNGRLVYDSLKSEGVDLNFCEFTDEPEERVEIEIVEGDRKFIKSTRNSRLLPDITTKILTLTKNALLVHSGCHSNSEQGIKKIHENGAFVSYDFSEMKKYHTDDYLMSVGSSVDIAQFSFSDEGEKERKRILDVCKKCKIKYVLTTNGSSKPMLFDLLNNKVYEGIVEKIKEPRDTMGAGDTYFASFAVEIVKGLSEKGKVTKSVAENAFTCAARAAHNSVMNMGSFGYGINIK